MNFYEVYTNNYTPELKNSRKFLAKFHDYKFALSYKLELEKDYKGMQFMYPPEGYVEKEKIDDLKFWIESK